MKNRMPISLALCSFCILGLASMLMSRGSSAQQSSSNQSTNTGRTGDAISALRISDPQLRKPEQGKQKERECLARRPNAVNTRAKGVGRACTRDAAERLAELDLAKQACTGDHDPECEGQTCAPLPGGKCVKHASPQPGNRTKCTQLKNERCPGAVYFACVSTGNVQCRCACD